MKRIVAAGVAALVYSVVMPLVALAQEGSGLDTPEGPQVSGGGGSLGGGGGAGTAFTGAEIAGLVILAVVIAAAGITALVVARRRSIARAGA
jgi:hypothetical protein